MRTHVRRLFAVKATLLVALVLATASFVGCSAMSDQDPNSGSASMAITLPDGSAINAVNYTISGNGITPITGTVNVTSAGSSVSFLVSGIPTGTGYLVKLDAVSTDGNTHCTGQSTFAVVAGQTTHVTVLLQCTGGNSGSVLVNGIFCPRLASFTASPLATAVGGTIDVSSTASDLDPSDDATPTFAWSATAGTFASTTAPATTYTCATAGLQTLTVTVSATSPTIDVTGCAESGTVMVSCTALTCGNGTVDTGEQCDPPNGTSCDSNCLQIPVCGNGVVETPVGPYPAEQCDPPNGTTCDATCHNIATVCGDGIVGPGEDCEPPNTATCDAACHTIGPAVCGNGSVESGEQCDPPAPAGNFTQLCSATCQLGTTLCQDCEATKCTALFGEATAWGCQNAADPTARANCEALLTCVRTTHCAVGARGNQDCYCGTASDLACLTGGANGQCKTQYETADGTTDPATIATDFVDPGKAIGLADNQLTCDADTTTGPTCTSVCPL